MRDKFRALLKISTKEESSVSMLLTQSVFIGIFIGAFDITAYSLLLSTYDEKLMARGYVVSGVAGFILSSVYLKLRSKSDFGKLSIFNLIFILAVVASLWLAMSYSAEKWIKFLVFVMLGPLNILSFLSFWGTAERLFHEKPDKVFRFLEAGLITGILIVSFLIPVLLIFNIQTHNILLISIASLFVALPVQIRMNKSYPFNNGTEEYTEDIIKRLPLFIKKDSFTRTLGLFAALSVLTAFLVQYTFMAIARKQFPGSEDMASFLGLFTGIMMIFSLFMKFAGFPFVIHHFRVNLSLLISPILVAVLSVLAVVYGLSINEATGGYIIIILILGINRLISKSFKDSVEIPSYKIIYQSISKRLKPEIQSGIDGTINEMGLVFSGVVLAGFGFLSFIKIIHFSILLFGVSLIWIFVGIRLLKQYRLSLKNISAEDLKNEGNPEPTVNQISKFSAGIEFRKDYFGIISGNLSVLNKINEPYFEELASEAISKRDINLLPALRKISGNVLLNNKIRQRSQEIIEVLNTKDVPASEGIRTLSGSRLPQTTEILRLLRNNSVDSKRLAIHMIGKFRISDLLSVVCESLNTHGISQDAYEVLLSFGAEAVDELVRFYLINSGNIRLSRTILHLLGKICTKETSGFLFSHLWSTSRQIREISVKSLLNCKCKPSEEEVKRLDNLAFEIAGIITWNLGAKMILEHDKNDFLLDKINRETERWETFLYNILSLNYGSDVIAGIRKNIQLNTMESVGHALEMVRETVSDSISQVLQIILGDIPIRKKLKRLSRFYPGEVSGHKNLAEDIINRDYNLISIWTKACTLRSIVKIEDRQMAESVTALLFSPEEIIQEESAYLIARSNPELYYSAAYRISGQVKRKLDKIVNGTTGKREMLFEKVQFLTKCFADIPSWELFSMARELHYISDPKEDLGTCDEGCILWSLYIDKDSSEVQLVYDGAVEDLKSRIMEISNLSYYKLSLASVEEYHFQYPDRTKEILGYVDKIQASS